MYNASHRPIVILTSIENIFAYSFFVKDLRFDFRFDLERFDI